MTIQWGDTGRVVYSPLRTLTITPGATRETLLGSPLTLPTTEPGTSQVSFTIQSSDLPTITGNAPMKYNACLVCSGKAGATAATPSYRVLKNGTSIIQTSGASVTASNYWSHTHWRTFDVQIGDVLEVRYWSNTTDANLDFYGLIVYPSQPVISKPNEILKDVTFSNCTNTLPAFSTTFSTSNSGFFRINFSSTTSATYDSGGNITIPSMIPLSPYGMFRNSLGDAAVGSTQQYVNATQRQIQRLWYPQTITFREILR